MTNCIVRIRKAGLWLAVAGYVGCALGQGGATDLTETGAVERALGRPALQALYAGALETAAGDLVQARTLSNPVLGLEREQLRGSPANERQSTYTISQRLELGGKRGLRVDAASARLAASEAEVQDRRRIVAYEVRRRFHEALIARLNTVALEAWERRLAEAETLAQSLQRGGEVAGYDRRRVARERATALSRLNSARADLQRALEVLRALVGLDPATPLTVIGPLLPDSVAPLDSYLARLEARPDLKALAARADAFRHDEALAQRSRIPDVTVSAGVKQVSSGPLSDSGVVLGLTIPLPIFERGEGGSRRAAGQARAMGAERELALTKAQGEVRGLWKQASQLQAAAREFQRDALEASRRLTEIARAAYRGGEAGILELLDAQRSLVDAETRAIELEYSARAAVLELDLIAAGENP